MVRAKQDRAKTTQTSPVTNCCLCKWHHSDYPFLDALQYSWLWSPHHWALHSTAGVIRNPSFPQESNRVIWLVTLKSQRTQRGKEYLTFSCFYMGEWICVFALGFHTHGYGPKVKYSLEAVPEEEMCVVWGQKWLWLPELLFIAFSESLCDFV